MHTESQRTTMNLVTHLEKGEWDVTVMGEVRSVYEAKVAINENGQAKVTVHMREKEMPGRPKAWTVPFHAAPAFLQVEVQKHWGIFLLDAPREVTSLDG